MRTVAEPVFKVNWQGKVIGVQPRIRLLRSFDERSHSYLGYLLYLSGTVTEQVRDFSVGIGKAAQAKYGFQVGDVVRGTSARVADERKESVEYYKTSGLKLVAREQGEPRPTPPPWTDPPPALEIYRQRGHRRLDARTYEATCRGCIWGCRMPVEIVVDQWNPSNKRYRFEASCYGPKSCGFYRAGPTHKVPGRRGVTWEEEDWVDEDATAHRRDNE